MPMTAESYPATLEIFFGADLAARVREEYPVGNYDSPSEAYAAAATDYLFSCPALMVNRWASQATPVYAYEFADRTAPSYLKPTTFPLGAAHTYELPYLFLGFHGGTAVFPSRSTHCKRSFPTRWCATGPRPARRRSGGIGRDTFPSSRTSSA